MTQLKFLVERFYQFQKHRVAMSNQLYQLKEDGEEVAELEEFYNEIYGFEKRLYKFIRQEVEKTNIWQHFLKDVKGIGPTMAASLLVTIDVHKTKHVSSLWKYAGMTPESRRVKGKKIDWNPFLKNTCFKIGQAFLKSKGDYKEIYDEAKRKYREKHPERIEENGKVKYNDGHIDMMARRYAIKIFLRDLWLVWRRLEGLSVTEPYVVEYLGHDKQPDNV